MRIISVNVNGIRSAYRKGFYRWLSRQRADVVCLQETKAQIHQLDASIKSPGRWFSGFFDAEKKGYSGVALYSRRKPDRIIKGLGFKECDTEGRYLQFDFGSLSIASIYVPSGSSGDARQSVKFLFLRRLLPILSKMSRQSRSYILCGDWNIAHKEIDLKNWKNIGDQNK